MSTYGTGTYGAATYGDVAGGVVIPLFSRLPLDLFAEVTTHDGTRHRWDANQAPGSRLRNFSFRTKIGEGFSDANGQLARRIDLDYPDLGLINTVTLTGADGSVAYEGRLSAMPRELSDTHSIGVTLAGWMAHAKDKKFSEVYIDRRLGEWQPANTTRRAATLSSVDYQEFHTVPDEGGSAALNVGLVGPWTRFTVCDAFYVMPATSLASRVKFDFVTPSATVSIADANWTAVVYAANAEQTSFPVSSGDWLTTQTGSVNYAPASPLRAFLIEGAYGAGPAGSASTNYDIWLKYLRVFGSHGLTIRGSTSATEGFYASDVMRDITSRYCPQLDTSGIQDTSYVIEQLAFTDRTFPFDAFLELNKYHLWHLGVWENKRLDFRPYDLTDYDWEIRTDDPGTTFSPQGPSTEDLFNGITVQYQDILTGTTNVLTPDTNAELADTSSTNPWNQHGIDHWDEIQLSTPDTESGAAFLGAAALADRNTAKTPGTVTVRGYIRDRAGNYQPAWKPRAGDSISITNFPNDSPRLIVETDYNDEDKTLRIAVDRPFQLLEAYMDRVGNALGARGLG